MKVLTKVTGIFDRIIALLAVLAAILIGCVMLLVCLEVVTRAFVVRPLLWVIEISEYSLVYITFLGTAWVLSREGHVKMDLVLNRLKPGTQCVVNIITSVIGAIVSLIIAWYGVRVTLEHFQTGYFLSKVIDLPLYLIAAVIPLGSLLLFIQFLRRTYRYLGSYRESPDKEQRS